MFEGEVQQGLEGRKRKWGVSEWEGKDHLHPPGARTRHNQPLLLHLIVVALRTTLLLARRIRARLVLLQGSTSAIPPISSSAGRSDLLLIALVELPEPRLEHLDPLRLLDLVEVLALGGSGLVGARTVGLATGLGLAAGVGRGADEAVEGEESALVELVDVELDLLVDVL